jgi:hypothetical protein
MCRRVRDLMQTVVDNAMEPGLSHVCRAVETSDIDSRFLPLIRKMFADRSEALLSGIQEGLKSSRWKRAGQTSRRFRIGLTIFSHEEEQTSNETTTHTYKSPTIPSKSGGKRATSRR